MKKISTLLIVASLLGTTFGNYINGNCVSECDTSGNTDYFTDKVSFDYAKKLNVEYHKYYKVVTYNTGYSNETNVFVQCGCDLSQTVIDQIDASLVGHTVNSVVNVPATGFAVQPNPSVGYFHALGALNDIKLAMFPKSSVSNECFKDRMTKGDVLYMEYGDVRGSVWADVSFTVYQGYGSTENITKPVSFQEWNEDSLIARSEYIKFASIFINEEKEANNVFGELEARVNCVEKNIDTFRVANDIANPNEFTTLWAYRSDYYSPYGNHVGWDIGDCDNGDNYYCSMANELKTELLHSNNGSIVVGSSVYMNDTEFKEFAKDADVWISSAEMNVTDIEIRFPFVKDFKSWKNKRVYDIALRSQNDWFQTSVVDASAVYEDFAMATNPSSFSFLDGDETAHNMQFLRNVLTQEVGSFGSCTGDKLPLLSDECYVWDYVESPAASWKANLFVTSAVTICAAMLINFFA